MKILKFGGSSIWDANRIKNVLEIIERSKKTYGEIAIVVSALQGITDKLIEAGIKAYRGESYNEILTEIEERHISIINELFNGADNIPTLGFIKQTFSELSEFVHGIWILGEITDRTIDYVMSYGELLSCRILTDLINERGIEAEYVDARKLIRTDLNYRYANVNFALTNWNILNHFKGKKAIQVVTGFIACGPNNETTTLGRGGSDYTASILGAALNANEIEVWSNVDGVLTADPAKVKDAYSIDSLTYEEAIELSHFGARVIHPPMMLPAMKNNIPVRVRNSSNPNFSGTLISSNPATISTSPIKGIACIEKVGLLKVKGEGIIRTSGIAARIFLTLARKEIEVIMITQSSSEHSMCIAIATEDLRTAREELELEFRVELHLGQISDIITETDVSIIVAIGEQIQNIPSVTGKIFEALGRNGIELKAVAYGSSERVIGVVISNYDLKKAMNALHDQLFLSQQKTLNLFLIGTGLVGSALLDLLQEQKEFIKTKLRTKFQLIGIANSRKMLFHEEGIDLSNWRNLFEKSKEKSDLNEFIKKIKTINVANSIVIDCTGVEETVKQYIPLFKTSTSIITSSKIANTLSFDLYEKIRITASQHGAIFRYSTNVGAALPIIDSIKNIINSGDSVERIEAVLSGTMSYIFNCVNEGKPFNKAVVEAKNLGYSESDPRIDLAGTDVARKLLILIREAGYKMEMDEITIEPFLTSQFFEDENMENALQKANDEILKLKNEASKDGNKLIYIAKFEKGKANIGLEKISPSHPFFHLSGNDNIVALTTSSLYRQPLIVRGSGAGPKLTASGILNDILYISHSMN